MKKPIHIMLVEDSPEYRETIAMAVDKEPDMELICQFGTAEEALERLQDPSFRTAPDLILLDLSLPGMSGTEALPLINTEAPDSKIIVLTQSNREADVLAAILAGTDGYLLKGASRLQLFDGVRTVIKGGAMIDPQVAKYIIQTMVEPAVIEGEHPLSKREFEILSLLGEGLVQKEISKQLQISNHTVVTHIRRIYDKLEVQNAPAAITRAYQSGIFRRGR